MHPWLLQLPSNPIRPRGVLVYVANDNTRGSEGQIDLRSIFDRKFKVQSGDRKRRSQSADRKAQDRKAEIAKRRIAKRRSKSGDRKAQIEKRRIAKRRSQSGGSQSADCKGLRVSENCRMKHKVDPDIRAIRSSILRFAIICDLRFAICAYLLLRSGFFAERGVHQLNAWRKYYCHVTNSALRRSSGMEKLKGIGEYCISAGGKRWFASRLWITRSNSAFSRFRHVKYCRRI